MILRRLIPLLLIAMLTAGCARNAAMDKMVAEKKLKPQEYAVLPESEKVRYKDIILRVPAQWGGAILPFDKGPYDSPVDKAVHGGDLGTLIGLYNQSLFELQNPRVKVEYINFDMWTDNFRSALAVALSAKKAPAYYIARDLPQTIEQGMYADITELMKTWDQFSQQPEGSIRQGTVNGHIYTIAANELGATVIRYRKDWFREAGIFNERGEPGPRSDWTWDDYRAYAKKLTDVSKNRHGGAADDAGSMHYIEANGLDLYIPDSTGNNDWQFNDKDPRILDSLKAVREIINNDKSITYSTTMGWYERHNEFDSGRVGMISSFSPHIARESITSPTKMGQDSVYRDTVGMAPFPRGKNGYNPLQPITNPIGFDPTLSKEQLKAAFEWCKSWFYGDNFLNRMRNAVLEAKLKGQQSEVYVEYLILPYTPKENLLDKPLEEVFPKDYTATYKAIREAHSPPLPRQYGLQEPPPAEFNKAVHALYAEAITSQGDLKALLAKHANLINTNLFRFGGKADREKMRLYIKERSEFYKKYQPAFYENDWKQRLTTYYRIPN
ncbi:MAG: extracellular solute-binding protein [Armatimonadetes bacterium]|nr:extracellular solute-binding protein [Armatimonadota bacterium]